MIDVCRRQEGPPMTFPEILSDPLVRALMQADHVDPNVLQDDLGRIARELRANNRSASSDTCRVC
jgi:hypothetical protein